ncbi:hypothetical protein GY24_16675 [Microterricola pindariensis]|uniref:HTH tetR-type domain-containing protein n=1 Tax=Microterricola pindariensis TaxID=478010 RepID=A0ABX5ASY2_9MICO|nr:hypothetical protein GY24_16675 [Microterricola pindariensis]
MPLAKLAGTSDLGAGRAVRTEPIQQRSAERLDALLDSAAYVVDQVGFDRITTAMIADHAGASIGTVYRYFPDRVAVLSALRDRSMARFRARVAFDIQDSSPQNWWQAIDLAITAFVDLYRTEPGFHIVHFTERQSVAGGPVAGADAEQELVAHSGDDSFPVRLAAVLSDEFGLDGGPELLFRLEVAIEIADGLLSRAFRDDPDGDSRFIAECRAVAHGYLVSYYGGPETA